MSVRGVDREGSNKVMPDHLITAFWSEELLNPEELTKTR